MLYLGARQQTQRRYRVPRVPLSIDWGSPFAFGLQGLYHAIPGIAPVRDITGQYAATDQGHGIALADHAGTHGLTFSSTERLEIPDALRDTTNSASTLICAFEHENASASGHLYDCQAGGSGGVDLWVNGGELRWAAQDPTTYSAATIGLGFRLAFGRHDGTTQYVNTDEGLSASTSGVSATASATGKIGNQINNADPLGSVGSIVWIGWWNYFWPDEMVEALSEDRWSLFRELGRRTHFLPAAAGGGATVGPLVNSGLVNAGLVNRGLAA